jgi:outer membrane protein OmpA-like peptidoglycan-associated protein
MTGTGSRLRLPALDGPAPAQTVRPGTARRAEHAADDLAAQVTGTARSPGPAREPALLPYDGPALGAGEPLLLRERLTLEGALGVDLSTVRIHGDARAADTADRYAADAVTVGPHVVFGRDRYRTDSADGLALLAHEVMHAVQQRGVARPVVQRQPRSTTGGIGRTPPPEPFGRGEGRADEDVFVLFQQDDATLDRAAQQRLAAAAGERSTPVLVEINGYASTEGDEEYDLNLSAWRAVAVRRALAPLLPAGSQVRVVARGESAAFGARDNNRRAGIRISALPAHPQPADAGQAPPLTARPSVTLGLPPLRLDPRVLVPPLSGAEPAGTPDRAVRPPGVLGPGVLQPPPVLDVERAVPRPPITPTRVLPDLFHPRLPDDPLLALPPSGRGTGIDWFSVRSSYQLHGVRLTDNDDAAIRNHFEWGYRLLVRDIGLPPSTAASLMNAFTSAVVNRELARENPNVIDRLNSDMKNAYPSAFGIPPLSIDLFNPPWRRR